MRIDDGEMSGGLGDDLAQSARMAAAFESELSRLRQSMAYTSREVGSLSSGLESGLRRAFDGLIFDGAKLSDALKGVGRALVDSVYAIAMRPVEGAIAGGIAGLMSGAVTPFAHGGAFQQGRTTGVGGDVVSQATGFPMRGGMGLLGEAGPEAIMPLRRGADGRLGVAAAGGGRAINVTFNISTPDVAGFQRSQSQVAAQMSRLLAQGDRNN